MHCIKHCVCVCVCKQEKLQSVTSESKELSSDINKRKQMLMKLEEKMQNAEEVYQQSFGNLNIDNTWTYLLLSPALYTSSRYAL